MRSVVIVLVLVAVAHADTAKSYAYVTKVNGYRTGTREHPHDHCDIVAKLPKTDLAAPPTGSDFGSDALTVSETTDDDNDHHRHEGSHHHRYHASLTPKQLLTQQPYRPARSRRLDDQQLLVKRSK